MDLPVDDADLLGKAAANAGYNRTTMLVRAIRLLSDIDKLARAGGHVQFVNADGSRETLRIL